jgi:hypothetical protein
LRCTKCAREATRYKVRKWADKNRVAINQRRATYGADSLKWAQDVEPAMTLKRADKLITDAIKGCL